MNNPFYANAKTFKYLPLRLLATLTGQNNIFPFYHLVDNKEVLHVKNLYKVRSVKSFEDDLDFILKNFSPIDLPDLLKTIKNNEPLPKHSFLLSFDDGLSQFHDIIAPILSRKGITAVTFLNSDFVDNKDLFYRYKASLLIEKWNISKHSNPNRTKINNWIEKNNLISHDVAKSILKVKFQNQASLDELASILEVDFDEYLKNEKPYLTSTQINSLINQGFSFGSHSVNHPLYSDLDIKDQLTQTQLSTESIVRQFNLDYKIFSFPFTDFGVKKVFFDSIFTPNRPIADVTFGCAGMKKDSIAKNIQRIPMESELYSAQEIIYGEYLYFVFKSLINKNIIKRN